jgi:hypothetical protein
MVTFAVAVAVLPPGAYCTLIVQDVAVGAGLITNPDTQVPPAMMENVPPAVPTFVIAGAAVSVMGPAVAPVAELETVIVPVLVVVSGVAVVNAGVGPANTAVPL